MSKYLYYRIDLVLDSALSIGAADSVSTDHDVVLDSRGKPLIPATSLTGVYRSFFEQHFGDNTNSVNKAFGQKLNQEANQQPDESMVRVYDATWLSGNHSISVRDNVSLKNKVAQPGLKFDRQIVERGAKFRTYIEVLDDSLKADDVEAMLSAIDAGHLSFGSKTTRGMGRMKVDYVLKREFDFKGPEDNAASENNETLGNRNAWLDFHMFEEDCWQVNGARSATKVRLSEAQTASDTLTITLALKQRGAISIREYSTEPSMPDFHQLSIRDSEHSSENDGIPVIPGTSWAGAFRSRYEEFVADLQPKTEAIQKNNNVYEYSVNATEQLFGFVKKAKHKEAVEGVAGSDSFGSEESQNGLQEAQSQDSTTQVQAPKFITVQQKSRIRFSESDFSQDAAGEWKTYTRNAIDRFTGGTIERALFTTRDYYNGQTCLTIDCDLRGISKDERDSLLMPLWACIADLHYGLLAVGGMTAVGHGIFEVTRMKCTHEEKIPDWLHNVIGGDNNDN